MDKIEGRKHPALKMNRAKSALQAVVLEVDAANPDKNAANQLSGKASSRVRDKRGRKLWIQQNLREQIC